MTSTKRKVITEPEKPALVVQDILTTKQVAAKLGLNVRSVELLGIPRIKLSHRTVRFAASDVNALLESCREETK
jgi:hypothetical protein